MSNCDVCPTNNSCDTTKEKCAIENNPFNEVKKVIAVMSGKGGVGKSTIAVLLAKTLKAKGYKVGILDADITGPSIPSFFKLSDKRVKSSEMGLIPIVSDDGIPIISLNLLIDDEEHPVIWRGPIISGVVKQFWNEVFWGDLDYLIIDMPPGTGDVALTVMQSIPINGMVMVSTPQDMVSMIVAKSVNMARTMNIPIIGIIENMSYLQCPDCGKKIKLYESQNVPDYIKRLDLTLLGELPMSSSIACLPVNKTNGHDESLIKTFNDIADNIINNLGKNDVARFE
ncbi:MAG: Mrp/NBP35 family ATP-binding protein [Bacillota bacterium]